MCLTNYEPSKSQLILKRSQVASVRKIMSHQNQSMSGMKEVFLSGGMIQLILVLGLPDFY
jgi:hypothetical protein